MTADVSSASPTVARRRRNRLLMVGLAMAALAALAAVLPQAAYHVLPPGLSGEADRLSDLLRLKAGMVVAEIGAGSGTLTVELARHVGPEGRVYATELSQSRLAEIRGRVKKAGLDNVLVIEAGEAASNLPDACCAAVVMRNVYHHIGDARAFNASLRHSVIDGGLVAIIDFEPESFLHLSSPPDGASPQRRGHGVLRPDLVRELGEAGFVVEREIEDWGGRNFLVLFRAKSPPPRAAATRTAVTRRATRAATPRRRSCRGGPRGGHRARPPTSPRRFQSEKPTSATPRRASSASMASRGGGARSFTRGQNPNGSNLSGATSEQGTASFPVTGGDTTPTILIEHEGNGLGRGPGWTC